MREKTGYKAFSMIELVIVITIIVILGGIALPNFFKAKEAALDKEARANLKLIQAANQLYGVEHGFKFPDVAGTWGTQDINTYLKLSLPEVEKNWNYTVAHDATNTARAKRTAADNRVLKLNINDEEPARE